MACSKSSVKSPASQWAGGVGIYMEGWYGMVITYTTTYYPEAEMTTLPSIHEMFPDHLIHHHQHARRAPSSSPRLYAPSSGAGPLFAPRRPAPARRPRSRPRPRTDAQTTWTSTWTRPTRAMRPTQRAPRGRSTSARRASSGSTARAASGST